MIAKCPKKHRLANTMSEALMQAECLMVCKRHCQIDETSLSLGQASRYRNGQARQLRFWHPISRSRSLAQAVWQSHCQCFQQRPIATRSGEIFRQGKCKPGATHAGHGPSRDTVAATSLLSGRFGSAVCWLPRTRCHLADAAGRWTTCWIASSAKS